MTTFVRVYSCKLYVIGILSPKYRTQKVAKNRHLGTVAQLCRATSWQLRHVSTIGKTWLNSNIASICLSSEDIAEIERIRDVAMATNFGTALAAKGL